jgi:hypothetical protein
MAGGERWPEGRVGCRRNPLEVRRREVRAGRAWTILALVGGLLGSGLLAYGSGDDGEAKLPNPVPFVGVMREGEVMVPMRPAFELLGAAVSWSEETKTVNAVKGETTVSVAANGKTAAVNGTAATLTPAPRTENGALLVPLKFVVQSVGATETYDAKRREVVVSLGEGRWRVAIQRRVEKPKKARVEHSYKPVGLSSDLEGATWLVSKDTKIPIDDYAELNYQGFLGSISLQVGSGASDGFWKVCFADNRTLKITRVRRKGRGGKVTDCTQVSWAKPGEKSPPSRLVGWTLAESDQPLNTDALRLDLRLVLPPRSIVPLPGGCRFEVSKDGQFVITDVCD